MEPKLTLEGKSVLVTGGAGFIGSHLVDRLIEERPARLTALDNLWLGRRENLAEAKARYPSLKLRVCNAASISAVEEVVRQERVEVFFDLATIPLPASHVKPRWSAEVIFRMATAAAELARRERYETLVHCSSSEVYGSAVRVPMDEDHPLNSQTPYAAAKAAADLLIRSYWETFGIDAAIVRPFNNYGPRQNDKSFAALIPIVLRGIQEGRAPTIHGDGDQTRDFMFVEDTAEALVRAYGAKGSRRRAINVGSGREVTVNEVVSRVCKLAEFPASPTHQPARPGDVRRHCADVRLAQELLGFSPRTSLDQGLARTVQWYLAPGVRR